MEVSTTMVIPNSTMQMNQSRPLRKGSFDVRFHTTLLVISSLIITMNMLVIFLFLTKESLRKAGKLLLCSLAVSDLTTGVITIPLNIACEVTFSLPLCLSSGMLNRFVAVSTVYHILAITFETYYAILRPMEHRVNMEQRKILALACGIWLGALVTALTPLYWTTEAMDDIRQKPSDEFIQKQTIYEIVVFSAGFLLPLTLMVFAHVRMFSKIINALRLLRRRSSPLRQPVTTSKYKTAMLFAVILLIFTVSWSFWFLAALLKLFGKVRHPFPNWLMDCLTILRYSTSFINPLLYTFFRPDFHKAFKSFLKKADSRRPSISLTYLLSNAKSKRDSQSNYSLARDTSAVTLRGTSLINCPRPENDTRV